MVKRRIIWTKSAQSERKEILMYWFNRTQSKTYSKKLNKLFSERVKLLSKHPKIRDYLIFYKFTKTELIILSIWDTKRDEKNTEFSYT